MLIEGDSLSFFRRASPSIHPSIMPRMSTSSRQFSREPEILYEFIWARDLYRSISSIVGALNLPTTGGSSHYAVLTRSLGEFLPFGRTGPGPGKDRNGSGLIHSGYTLTTGTMRMSWQLLRPHKSVCRMELARSPTSCSRPGV